MTADESHAERAVLHCSCGASIDVPSSPEWIAVADRWRYNHRHHGTPADPTGAP